MKKFFILFLLIVLFFYHKSLFAFFEGDEWFYFSQFLPLTKHWWGVFTTIYKSIFEAGDISGGGHLTPIYNLLWFLHNQIFGLSYLPYIILSIIFHSVNTFLLFVFVRLFLKDKIYSFIAALFFAISYVHYQAITWIMAYIPTQVSVTFSLLFLICLLRFVKDKNIARQRIFLRLAFLFFLFALLTKETAVIFFVISLILLSVVNKKLIKGIFLKYLSILAVFYGVYRIGVPIFYLWVDNQIGHIVVNSIKLDIPLYIFRAFTYPLKILSEVFIPSEWFMYISGMLTPYAYPDQATSLQFVQGAGSDILIYMVSVAIFVAVIYKLKITQDMVIKRGLIFGFSVTVLSALPLLLIALYAPWWGYVTIIDSRHLYMTSIGASILFAILIKDIAQGLAYISKNRLNTSFMLIILLIVWSSMQYMLLQKKLNENALTGKQRKTVVKKVLSKVPIHLDNKVILIESNWSYYAYSGIPPFQTNLGQILMLYYYDLGQLPQSFIIPGRNVITKGNLQTEGYIKMGGKLFGYFNHKKTLLDEVEKKSFAIENVYSFKWHGEDNRMEDTTDDTRKTFAKIIESKKRMSDWVRFIDKENGLTFIAPPGSVFIKDIDPSTGNVVIKIENFLFTGQIEIVKVPAGKGFYDIAGSLTDADGEKFDDISIEVLELNDIQKQTGLSPKSKSAQWKTFIPIADKVFSFTMTTGKADNLPIVKNMLGSVEIVKE